MTDVVAEDHEDVGLAVAFGDLLTAVGQFDRVFSGPGQLDRVLWYGDAALWRLHRWRQVVTGRTGFHVSREVPGGLRRGVVG